MAHSRAGTDFLPKAERPCCDTAHIPPQAARWPTDHLGDGQDISLCEKKSPTQTSTALCQSRDLRGRGRFQGLGDAARQGAEEAPSSPPSDLGIGMNRDEDEPGWAQEKSRVSARRHLILRAVTV